MTPLLPIALFLLVLFWGWYSAGLVIAIPRDVVSVLPGAFGMAFDDADFRSADGVPLKGWWVPAKSPSAVTIFLCHGWGATRSDILPSTHFLNVRGGYNLFYFDFRNHGDSGGTKSSLTLPESQDLEAALAWVRERHPEGSRRVGLYGHSMGGAVAILTASRRPEFEAVVAESAFTSFNRSVVRFAALFYRVPAWAVPYTLWWVRLRLGFNPEPYSPENVIDKIAPRPLLLIQGGHDMRMPPSEGEKLLSRAKEPKALWTIPNADHGESWEVAGAEYQERILRFYRDALK